MANYLSPDALVDTNRVIQHMKNKRLRIVECDGDPVLYSQGHIPGAVRLDTQTELEDERTRDLIRPAAFEALAGRLGIDNDTEVVFYGDQHNIQACYAYWVFRSFGHDKLKILNGGREKWLADGQKLTHDVTDVPPARHTTKRMLTDFRALRDDVLRHIGGPENRRSERRPDGRALIDDRTRAEFEGVFAQESGYPQRFVRSGHIPGAANVPFTEILRHDGTFKSVDEIKRVLDMRGIAPDMDVVVYTRIGERASLMWFVLHELLRFPRVRVYDGSWTEWGNTVGLPIEAGAVLPIPPRTVPGTRTAMPRA
jgi:thiosulfate/3-mercaptopyruvate sulfurtransferase